MKKWPSQDVYFWDKAPFFRLLVPLVAGITSYAVLHKFYPVLIVGILTAFIAITTAFVRKHTSLTKGAYFISLNIALAAAGWLVSYYYDIRNNTDWFANNRTDIYAVRIANEPAEKDKTWKLEVDVIGTGNKTATGRAFVYVYKNNLPLLFHDGDTLLLPDKWQRIKTAGNPFEFDYARYCGLNNIYYQQFLSSDEVVLAGQTNDLPWIRRAHKWCMQQLALYITDKPTLGLMQAMLIGDEANLDPELRQAYSETGIVHIIAISGSHITFFFLIISFLLGWIRHNRWKWLKYLTAIPLIWTYVIMSGAPPSAVRAALMFSVFALGLAFEKQPNNLNQLLAAAFMLLLVNPNWLYAIGFQLSFLAVLSLVLFYKPIHKLYQPTNKVVKGVWAAIAASLAAEILTAPLAVYYFHLFPLLFVVANVLAYLFMGVVLIAGMSLIAISPFASVAKLLAAGITALVKFFNYLVYAMQGLNPQSFRFLQINVLQLAMVFFIITCLSVFLIRQKKAGLFAGLVVVCLLLATICFDEWNALHQQKLVVYNISKVNHIEFIDGNHHSILYSDTTVTPKTKSYVLKPTHTGYKAWRSKPYTGNKELITIGNKTALILNEPINTDMSFPVDYLIVNYKPDDINFETLQKTFTPEQIVFGSNISRSITDRWLTACKQKHIPLYSVLKEGAFEVKNF
jgi:competence protein ComEC